MWYPSNSLQLWTCVCTQSQYATHKMLITLGEKWNGQHLTISSLHSPTYNFHRRRCPTFEYPFSYLDGLRVHMNVWKTFSISRSPLFLVHVVDSREMYTAHSLKTHTTNGWKNIIFYLISFLFLTLTSLTRAIFPLLMAR